MKKALSPLYGTEGTLLNTNPDRGFRLEIAMDVERVAKVGSYEKMKKEADSIISKAVTNQESVKLAQLYLYLSGFNKGNITDKGLQAIEACLDALHDRGMKAILRFADSGKETESYPCVSGRPDRCLGRMAQRVLSAGQGSHPS